jgi:hypothetical protein
VELGVANELFPNERSAVPGCIFNATPEDSSNIIPTGRIFDSGRGIPESAKL